VAGSFAVKLELLLSEVNENTPFLITDTQRLKILKKFLNLCFRRAVFRQTEGAPNEKLSRGFVRLDSLGGDCYTHKMSDQPLNEPFESFGHEVNIKDTPTKAEAKWFGNYDSSASNPYSPKSKYFYLSVA
jgi:hypothetical protein